MGGTSTYVIAAYHQDPDAVGGSLGLSALVSALPLLAAANSSGGLGMRLVLSTIIALQATPVLGWMLP